MRLRLQIPIIVTERNENIFAPVHDMVDLQLIQRQILSNRLKL